MSKDPTTPLISACFFSYNSADTLPNAIASLFDNVAFEFEVVVVDDGSTDDTEAAIRRMRLPNLRYLKKEHSGRPASRNRCIQEARGEYVLWLGADDRLNKGVLNAYAEAMRQHPEAGVLYGDIMVADLELNPVRVLTYEDWTGRPQDVPAGMVLRNGVPDSGTLVKKALYTEHGGYDLDFPRAQDYEWYARVAGSIEFRHIRMVTTIWRILDPNRAKNQPKSSYGSVVVERLLQRYPLRQLLPQAGWGHIPDNQAESMARLMLAERFFKLRAPDKALSQLQQVLSLKPQQPILQQAVGLLDTIKKAGSEEAVAGS